MDGAELVVSPTIPRAPNERIHRRKRPGIFGFSTGWYIYDDGLDHETTSSPAHVIDTHGDTDLYWYTGVHGMIGTTDREADFARMREYVITGAGAPTEVTGPISFSSSSHLATFAFATYTYVACDFWIEPDEDPVVRRRCRRRRRCIMVNGHILGHMYLHSEPQHWSLHEVGRPGEVNTLIAILVDDCGPATSTIFGSADGVMVE